MNPFFLMAALFAALAFLQAVDTALVKAGFTPAFAGLVWLRVHLITLGIMTETLFGALPRVVAWRQGSPQPGIRWITWVLLTGGILILMAGVPSAARIPVYTGGALVGAATVLMLDQLRRIGAARDDAQQPQPSGRRFYLAGLCYLLVGITVGTGLLFNWAEQLGIVTPREVHIHANNFGFMAMSLAGLFIDLYPRWSGKTLAWPRSLTPIFLLMALGVFGLVLGPWVGVSAILGPGMLIYVASTIWLLSNLVRPLRGSVLLRRPGIWHLTTGYAWLVAPVLVAPFILLEVPGFPHGAIEGNAPQALVYGWLLQVGFALVPYFFARVLVPGTSGDLGGSWISLATGHLGAAFLWAGIFVTSFSGELHAVAYGLWAVSFIPLLLQLWRIAQLSWVEPSEARTAI